MSDFAAPTLHKTGSDQYSVTYGNDAGNFAEFSLEPVHQEFASQEAGRPVYKDEIFITIYTPADRSKKVFRKAVLTATGETPADPDRFPKQWAAFQNQREQVQDGLPLEQWPPLTKSQVLEFKAMKIHTVEALAGLSDAQVQNLGIGGRSIRDMAEAYLAKASPELTQLAADNQRMSAELEGLKMKFAALGADPEDIDDQPQARKPGRPKRVA